MNVRYVHQNKFYLISNHAVAQNRIFKNQYYVRRFLAKVEGYLSPICEIMGHCIHGDQFQLVVKLSSREAIESFYRGKYPERIERGEEIPEDTYIFSQLMANLQSSMAIHFNRKESRTGAVFARRFSKILISSMDELRYWLGQLKKERKLHVYERSWAHRGNVRRGWFWSVGEKQVSSVLERFKTGLENGQLQGQTTKNQIRYLIYLLSSINKPKKPPT